MEKSGTGRNKWAFLSWSSNKTRWARQGRKGFTEGDLVLNFVGSYCHDKREEFQQREQFTEVYRSKPVTFEVWGMKITFFCSLKLLVGMKL